MGREDRTDLEVEARKEKRRHKEKRNKVKLNVNSSLIEVGGDNKGKVVEGRNNDRNDGTHICSTAGVNNKKKRKRENEGIDLPVENEKEVVNDEEILVEEISSKGNVKKRKKILEDKKMGVTTEHGELLMKKEGNDKKKKKKKKRKKEKLEDTGGGLVPNVIADAVEGEDKKKRKKKDMSDKLNERDGCKSIMESVDVEESKEKKSKSKKHVNVEDCPKSIMESVDVEESKEKKKSKSKKHVNVEDRKKQKEAKSKKYVMAQDCSEDNKKAESGKGCLGSQKGSSHSKKALKRVSFADDVEVFTTSDGPGDEQKDLVRGKWFSEEEDKLVKKAVLGYIEEHGLGDDGLDMVLHVKSHPEVKNIPEIKNCWKDIGAALPWRPFKSVYYRAHILFEQNEQHVWTPEEYEQIRKFHKEHGADWRKLGDRLGKHRIHVKDAWRRIKLPNQKKGRWSQEEYENLFDLVNMDLRMKVFEEKKSKHGMLRDNICWEAISEKLGTRTNPHCCTKWYNQLTSPLVSQNLWADIDDYRLLDALNSLDACCIEDVNWDDLLEHRAGDICLKRWNQMVKHIGQHALKSFPEQVEILSKRYLADLIEAKEIYANKPVVD